MEDEILKFHEEFELDPPPIIDTGRKFELGDDVRVVHEKEAIWGSLLKIESDGRLLLLVSTFLPCTHTIKPYMILLVHPQDVWFSLAPGSIWRYMEHVRLANIKSKKCQNPRAPCYECEFSLATDFTDIPGCCWGCGKVIKEAYICPGCKRGRYCAKMCSTRNYVAHYSMCSIWKMWDSIKQSY